MASGQDDIPIVSWTLPSLGCFVSEADAVKDKDLDETEDRESYLYDSSYGNPLTVMHSTAHIL